jgi:hypothetical protein
MAMYSTGFLGASLYAGKLSRFWSGSFGSSRYDVAEFSVYHPHSKKIIFNFKVSQTTH